jgi:hypothetical protein
LSYGLGLPAEGTAGFSECAPITPDGGAPTAVLCLPSWAKVPPEVPVRGDGTLGDVALRYFDFGAGVMPLFLQELASGAQTAGHPPEAA